MTQAISPTTLVLTDEAKVLEAIKKASEVFSREQEEMIEAAKLVGLRRLDDHLIEALGPMSTDLREINISMGRIADVLERLESRGLRDG